MTRKTLTDLRADIAAAQPDNNTRLIDPADTRGSDLDSIDSLVSVTVADEVALAALPGDTDQFAFLLEMQAGSGTGGGLFRYQVETNNDVFQIGDWRRIEIDSVRSLPVVWSGVQLGKTGLTAAQLQDNSRRMEKLFKTSVEWFDQIAVSYNGLALGTTPITRTDEPVLQVDELLMNVTWDTTGTPETAASYGTLTFDNTLGTITRSSGTWGFFPQGEGIHIVDPTNPDVNGIRFIEAVAGTVLTVYSREPLNFTGATTTATVTPRVTARYWGFFWDGGSERSGTIIRTNKGTLFFQVTDKDRDLSSSLFAVERAPTGDAGEKWFNSPFRIDGVDLLSNGRCISISGGNTANFPRLENIVAKCTAADIPAIEADQLFYGTLEDVLVFDSSGPGIVITGTVYSLNDCTANSCAGIGIDLSGSAYTVLHALTEGNEKVGLRCTGNPAQVSFYAEFNNYLGFVPGPISPGAANDWNPQGEFSGLVQPVVFGRTVLQVSHNDAHVILRDGAAKSIGLVPGSLPVVSLESLANPWPAGARGKAHWKMSDAIEQNAADNFYPFIDSAASSLISTWSAEIDPSGGSGVNITASTGVFARTDGGDWTVDISVGDRVAIFLAEENQNNVWALASAVTATNLTLTNETPLIDKTGDITLRVRKQASTNLITSAQLTSGIQLDLPTDAFHTLFAPSFFRPFGRLGTSSVSGQFANYEVKTGDEMWWKLSIEADSTLQAYYRDRIPRAFGDPNFTMQLNMSVIGLFSLFNVMGEGAHTFLHREIATGDRVLLVSDLTFVPVFDDPDEVSTPAGRIVITDFEFAIHTPD